MARRIRFKCRCGNILAVTEAHRGKKGRCPKCGHVFLVPDHPFGAPASPDEATGAPDAGAEAPPGGDGVPRCRNHADRIAAYTCCGCRSGLCEECANVVEDYAFCEECVCNPGETLTPLARAGQAELLRRRGVATQDVSKDFSARSAGDAVHLALNSLTLDGRLLYFGVGLLVAFSCLSLTIVGLVLQKGWAGAAAVWLAIAAIVQVFVFGGLAGSAKDVLFGLDFDAGRFLAHCLRGLKRSWPAAPLVLVAGFACGPVVWSEPATLWRMLIAGGYLGAAFFVALPALMATIENKSLLSSLRQTLRHLADNWMTILGLDLIAGLLVALWIYSARGPIASSVPFLVPDALTALVMPLVYIGWIMASVTLYFSLGLSRENIADRAPPRDLPRPGRKPTMVAIAVALAAAVALATVFYTAVGRKDTTKAVAAEIKIDRIF